MDIATVLNLIDKGMAIASMLVDAGKDAAPAIAAIGRVATASADNTITEADLTEIENQLDAMLLSFNEPLPPA